MIPSADEHTVEDDADAGSWSAWLPHWLHDTRLDDEALAQAYEQSPAPQRACVKQCLALLHALWGEECEGHSHTRGDRARGFCVTHRTFPAPWALFVVSADYRAPTRLAAALMPALLARVPHVGVLCVGGMPSVGTRLALELTGVQDIFCLPEVSAAEACLRELCTPNIPVPNNASGSVHQNMPDRRGCVALLHHGSLHTVAHTASTLRLPLWEEASAPYVKDATGNALVRLCHPDLATSCPTDAATRPYNAVFGRPDTETPQTLAAPLRVETGMEGFWLHHTLEPAFFRRQSLHMTPYTGEDAWARI